VLGLQLPAIAQSLSTRETPTAVAVARRPNNRERIINARTVDLTGRLIEGATLLAAEIARVVKEEEEDKLHVIPLGTGGARGTVNSLRYIYLGALMRPTAMRRPNPQPSARPLNRQSFLRSGSLAPHRTAYRQYGDIAFFCCHGYPRIGYPARSPRRASLSGWGCLRGASRRASHIPTTPSPPWSSDLQSVIPQSVNSRMRPHEHRPEFRYLEM
jgi:hypothetical protein